MTKIAFSDAQSIDLIEAALDAGQADAEDIAEIQRRMRTACDLAEQLYDTEHPDDPDAELEAVRAAARVANGLRAGRLWQHATISQDDAEVLRRGLDVHVSHLQTMAWLSRRHR